MTGHQKFSQLTANFSESRKAKIAAKTEQLKEEIARIELSQLLATYQSQISHQLNLSPDKITQLEKDTELYLGSLYQAIKNLGGELRITVQFPEQDFEIEQK